LETTKVYWANNTFKMNLNKSISAHLQLNQHDTLGIKLLPRGRVLIYNLEKEVCKLEGVAEITD